MSDNIGYPESTNRAGGWHGGAQRQDEHAHLRDLLRPVQNKGIQSVGLIGLDDEAKAIMELVDRDKAKFFEFGRAIQTAVDASRMSHPQFIGTDRAHHQISQAETKRRINWCVSIALRLRSELKWSLARIRAELPSFLGYQLDGDLEGKIKENRSFWRSQKTPRGLK